MAYYFMATTALMFTGACLYGLVGAIGWGLLWLSLGVFQAVAAYCEAP